MCVAKRDPTDALQKLFHDRYGLNLLALPAADVEPGQFVIAPKGAVARRVEAGAVLDGPLDGLQINRAIPMADVSGVRSNGVSAGLAADIAEAFIIALGGLGLATKFGAKIRREKCDELRFSFPEPSLDKLELAVFRGRIAPRRLDVNSPFHDPAARYFVVNAVARSRALDIVLDKSVDGAGEVAAGFAKLVDVEANLSVEIVDGSVVRFRGDRALAFGVELFQFSTTESGHLKLGIPTSPLPMREKAAPNPAFLAEQSLFVTLTGS